MEVELLGSKKGLRLVGEGDLKLRLSALRLIGEHGRDSGSAESKEALKS